MGSDVRPLKVKFEPPYLVWPAPISPHGEMVFDVSMWQLVEDRHLVVVQATPGNPGGPTRMSKDACGRDFVVNADEGTISPRTAPHLVLGFAKAGVARPWSAPYARIDATDMEGRVDPGVRATDMEGRVESF